MKQRERLSGLTPTGVGYVVSAMAGVVSSRSFQPLDKAAPIVIVCASTAEAEELSDALSFFLGTRSTREDAKLPLAQFLNWEVLPFDSVSPTFETSAERLYALSLLLSNTPSVIVTTVQATMQQLLAPKLLEEARLEVTRGMRIARGEFITKLDLRGYTRTTLVESVGQFAARGAVIDVATATCSLPIRVEHYGDEIRTIRLFDPGTQRTVREVESVTLLPVREFLTFDGPALANKQAHSVQKRVEALELPASVARTPLEAVKRYESYPGLEHLAPLFKITGGTLLDYLPEQAVLVLRDQLQTDSEVEEVVRLIKNRSESARRDGILFPEPSTSYLSSDEWRSRMRERTNYYFDTLDVYAADDEVSSRRAKLFLNEELRSKLKLAESSERPLEPLAKELKELTRAKVDVVISVSHPNRTKRLQHLLERYDISLEEAEGDFARTLEQLRSQATSEIRAIPKLLPLGLRAADDNLVIISESEIFPSREVRSAGEARQHIRRFLGSLSLLKDGDYIVHVDHGVGYYRGLRSVTVQGKTSDFLELEYAEESKLLIPVENIGKIQKYVGAEGKQPALNKLGTKNWERSKRKIRKSVTEIAGELINLYAEREAEPGFAFASDSELEVEFAESFPYVETPDQLGAIEDVLTDMTRARPMDRLVCGDVGYGKTEVAMRAAFKAVCAGKQVALLVPTTVLAEQHFTTLRDRLSDFGVRVGCVSRFYGTASIKETLEKVSSGNLDIVIGTHRLLQSDVDFNDLGLLIIDEEHRFGVKHKERLKQYRRYVDVLTLTATPIPRTLHMSMVGIRDLSVIETAPHNRQAIRTYLAPYSDEMVREAILRELQRSGQVFYIHNRVQNIGAVTDELRELVPEARIEFAHGQMKEKELESIMHRFNEREFDVLVSTTIVESGLDIPNANTMIIRRADMFGLAELYQLRGRVGRSSRRAYAYLLIPDPKTLGVEARKRLKVLQSLDDLGQGFRLALQDMEIRGAGNLLGKDQSGHVAQIGYELYSRILKEAVIELKAKVGTESREEPFIDPDMNVGFSAHIPPVFIPDVAERLILYQRLADLDSFDAGYELAEEIEDRFGHYPKEVEELVELMMLRALLKNHRVLQCNLRGKTLSLRFHPSVEFDAERVVKFVQSTGASLTPDGKLKLELQPEDLGSPVAIGKRLRLQLEQLISP